MKIRDHFGRQSLSRQFLLVSFPILLVATLAIGWWIGRQVEDSVVHRIGSVTALYVDSFVAPHIQSLNDADDLSLADRQALAADLIDTQLGKKIVELKIWRKDGQVLFSTDEGARGKKFRIDEGLATGLNGGIFSEISEREDEDLAGHGQPMPRLIETYTPIHADGTGKVIAAAEFYLQPDEVDREAGVAQRRSWLIVAGTMLAMYFALFLVVRRGSATIDNQRSELRQQVQQLTELNEKNSRLQERVIRAAERATTLNEHFLQRISADIHDGPVQDLGFVLMQIKNIGDATDAATSGTAQGILHQAAEAVESALKDLRSIAADIELPDIAQLSPAEIAARVVRDFQIKTGASISLDTAASATTSSFRVKVALYRLLQESLANSFRHAQCKDCRVTLGEQDGWLKIDVSDHGPGFSLQTALSKGRLGLHGMRQRIEVLGGTFDIQSVEGQGTMIRVSLPPTHDNNDSDSLD